MTVVGRAAQAVGSSLYPLLVPVVIVVAWWYITEDSINPFWPPLSSILATFRQDWLFDLVPVHLAPSLLRIGVGYGLAVMAAVALGTLLGLASAVRGALLPLLDFARATPGITLIPAAFFLFGIGHGSKIAIVAWISFWPILLNTIDGVRGVDPMLRDMTKVYRFTRADKVFRVVLPSASPQIFAGLRIAVAYALIGVVVAEMLISSSGIGYYIANAKTHLKLREMWAGIFVLMIVAYAMNVAFLAVERRILAWHRGSRAAALGRPVETRRRLGLGMLRRGRHPS